MHVWSRVACLVPLQMALPALPVAAAAQEAAATLPVGERVRLTRRDGHTVTGVLRPRADSTTGAFLRIDRRGAAPDALVPRASVVFLEVSAGHPGRPSAVARHVAIFGTILGVVGLGVTYVGVAAGCIDCTYGRGELARIFATGFGVGFGTGGLLAGSITWLTHDERWRPHPAAAGPRP